MEDDYIKWRNLIGDFMLVFAEVEGELNDLLSDLTSVEEYKEIIKHQFKAHQAKVKLLVKSKVSDENLVNRVNTLLDQLLRSLFKLLIAFQLPCRHSLSNEVQSCYACACVKRLSKLGSCLVS